MTLFPPVPTPDPRVAAEQHRGRQVEEVRRPQRRTDTDEPRSGARVEEKIGPHGAIATTAQQHKYHAHPHRRGQAHFSTNVLGHIIWG